MARKKITELATFFSLPKKQQKAVMYLFAGNMTQEKIAKEIDCNPSSITHWKQLEDFRKAQDEYNQFMLHDLTSQALVTMRKLLHAKSEMVRFNAAKDILDRSMTVSALEDAQQRKANADAAMAEAKLADMQDNKDDQMDALANMLSKLAKNVPKDDQNDD
uniref:hypothetical protein n=1 Tax=Lentilactobacillus hilgardii TaxID=1588 RepID=UPI00403F4B47